MAYEKAKGRLDVLTNILTIVVAIGIVTIAVQRLLLPSDATSNAPEVGTVVRFTDFDPSGTDKNVLLVLMQGCRFCEESMGFYSSLLQQNQNSDIKFVAIFPPETEDPSGYLKSYGVPGLEARYSKLSSLQVGGTPTIIITDATGKVTKTWSGKLSPEKEEEVIIFLKS